MSGYTPILATLIYVLSPDRKQVLLIHRNTREDDQHYGKYNGLGGKLEINEDLLQGMKRELHEEAGIVSLQHEIRGTLSWPGFGKNGEDWFAFIFLVQSFEGEVVYQNREGKLAWIDLSKVLELPLWEGDRHFLPLVFDNDPSMFHGVMPYENTRPVSWSFSR